MDLFLNGVENSWLKKLLITRASLLVTRALLLVATSNKGIAISSQEAGK